MLNPTSSQPLGIRTASAADLDDITDLVQAAMIDDPLWNYRFPFWKEYPEDNWFWTRRKFQCWLEKPLELKVLVAGERNENDEERVGKPVAVAAWYIKNVPEQAEEGIVLESPVSDYDGLNIRKDAIPKRITAVKDAVFAGSERYFADWHSTSIGLYTLATHPEHQRRGAGKLLIRWGMDIAEKQNRPVTLFASAVGDPLYTRLGFKGLGRQLIQVEGEDEKFEMYAMAWNV